MTTSNLLSDTFLASVAKGGADLVKAFDDADRAVTGDSGYELSLAAAKALAFPEEALADYNPSDKGNAWVTVVASAQDMARPANGPTARAALVSLAQRAVNASTAEIAAAARTANPKVPAYDVPKDTTSAAIEAELREEASLYTGDNSDPDKRALYNLIVSGINSEEGLVAIGKRINSETVAGARWIGRAIYLPLIEGVFDEYTGATRGYATKKVGSVWQETCRKAAKAHKDAFKDDAKPTLEDIQAAIEDAARTELGLDNINAVIHGERAEKSEEEKLAAALAAVYFNLRKMDELTGGQHNFHAACKAILKPAGADLAGEKVDEAKRASDKRRSDAELKAQQKRDRAAQLQAKKDAIAAKPVATAAATGVDTSRAQAEIDAADKAAKGAAKKGPVAKAASKPDVAALDKLQAQVAGKPASAKPVAGKRA